MSVSVTPDSTRGSETGTGNKVPGPNQSPGEAGFKRAVPAGEAGYKRAAPGDEAEYGGSGASRERVELILHQLDRLPTLGPIAIRVLALAASDNSTASDLVEIIELDPALSAGILRMVRRADLGVQQKDIGVSRAVTLLGFNAVRNAVLCSEVFDLFGSRVSSPDQDVRTQFWLHGIAAACASEWIAEKLGKKALAGDAFVCGLMHDIGKIALEFTLPKSYARVIERVRARRMCVCTAEQEVFGLDHTVAGKRLVGRWQLPGPIAEAAWLHHHDPTNLPSFVQSPDILHIVQLADQVVRDVGIGFSGYRQSGDAASSRKILGLSNETIEELTAALPNRMGPMLAAMGLATESSAGEAEPLQAVHQHLRRVCSELSTENRRLSERLTVFETVREFARRTSPRDTIGDVCAAGADAVCAALPADAACLFVRDRDRAFVYAGWTERGGRACFDAFETDAEDKHSPAPVSMEGVSAASAAQEWVWRRCIGSSPQSVLWALPIGNCENLEAALLIQNGDGRIKPLLSHGLDWSLLERCMGSAIASAWSRTKSERTTEELIDLNRKLREAQADLLRMRSIAMVSEMAAGAAHELNNPLAVISGRAQMELRKAGDQESRRAMEVIIAQTTKAAQIVLDLMNFAKPDSPSPIAQPLSQVLQAVYQHWQGELGSHSQKLTVSLPAEGLTVFGDAAQLITALNEVIANAMAATGILPCDQAPGEAGFKRAVPGGEAGFNRANAPPADSAERRVSINSPSHHSDETVRIVIEDNGIGMTPDVLEHAVDPFFSSRPAGRGRGLGLSRAYRLMEINGGRLWIESKPNVGTTVTLEVPARARK